MALNCRRGSRSPHRANTALTEYHGIKVEDDSNSELGDKLPSEDDEEDETDEEDGALDGALEDDGDLEEDEDTEEDRGTEQGEDEEPINKFKPKLKIPPYEHAKRQLSQLLDLMNGPYLDLSPHYQRDVVWTRGAMRLLIDSIWTGYYIPPVIFNITTVEDEDGVLRYKRTCVDGKQRLTAIREFMTGQFPCLINNKGWYFCNPTNQPKPARSRRILPEFAREEFKKIELLCTEYKGLSMTQELEIFQRVQLGMRLSNAESFRATRGVWQDLAKQYVREFSDVVNLVRHKRASEFRLVLFCFMQIYECFEPSGKDGRSKVQNTTRMMNSFCSKGGTLDSTKKHHLRFVFSLFRDLAAEDCRTFENNGYAKSKKFTPLELLAVCVLISQKSAGRPKDVLRGDILTLRSRLRMTFPVLRITELCWKVAWDFISNLEHYRPTTNNAVMPANPPKLSKIIKRISQVQPLTVAAPDRNLHLTRRNGQRHKEIPTMDTPLSSSYPRPTANKQHPSLKKLTSHRRSIPSNSFSPAKAPTTHHSSTHSNPSTSTNNNATHHPSSSTQQSPAPKSPIILKPSLPKTKTTTTTTNSNPLPLPPNPPSSSHLPSPSIPLPPIRTFKTPTTDTNNLPLPPNPPSPSHLPSPTIPLPPRRTFKPSIPTPTSHPTPHNLPAPAPARIPSPTPSSPTSNDCTPSPIPPTSRKRSAPDLFPEEGYGGSPNKRLSFYLPGGGLKVERGV